MALFSRKERDLSKVTIEGLLATNSVGSTAALRRAILRKLATQRVWLASRGLPDGVDAPPGVQIVLERDAPVQLLTTEGPEGGLAMLWFSSGAAAHERSPQCVALAVDFAVAVERLQADESLQGVVLDAAGTHGWAYFPRSEVFAVSSPPR